MPPAEDFQRRLDVELADKAFVCVLESPSVTGSHWVAHEVAYALDHQIGLVGLTLPAVTRPQRFRAIDDAFRIALDDADLIGRRGDPKRTLKKDSLTAILEQIEWGYAALMRRRRAQLMGSVREWLDRAGHTTVAHDDWSITASASDGSETVYLVTPRSPQPHDVREADRLRGNRDAGLVVFGAPVQDPTEEELISWICDQRPLDVTGHLLLPARLGL